MSRFEVVFRGFGDDLFFGIVRRGGAMLMLKDVGLDSSERHRDSLTWPSTGGVPAK